MAINRKPVIAITQGDPAGVGPEICLKAIQSEEVLACCLPVILGDMSVLGEVAAKLGLPMPSAICHARELNENHLGESNAKGLLADFGLIRESIQPGAPTRLAGEASYSYIEFAIQRAMENLFDGTVTAPITKTTLKMAGIHEPGHTEIYGKLTRCENFAMMLYSSRIAVSFVTCHQSLRSVPDTINIEDVYRVASLTRDTLLAIRGHEPMIAMLGLNPHAGEDGLFGDEEERIIQPAIQRCRDQGWRVEGPIPPDAAFMPHNLPRFDGHVTHYHDQGGIPFKMISMHDGVNITMGLPIVRASVDHGTAYDIAWKGSASPSSLISAIQLASRLALMRRNRN